MPSLHADISGEPLLCTLRTVQSTPSSGLAHTTDSCERGRPRYVRVNAKSVHLLEHRKNARRECLSWRWKSSHNAVNRILTLLQSRTQWPTVEPQRHSYALTRKKTCQSLINQSETLVPVSAGSADRLEIHSFGRSLVCPRCSHRLFVADP